MSEALENIDALPQKPDGGFWFTAWGGNSTGFISSQGAMTSVAIPTPNAELHGIAVRDDGTIWAAPEVG